MNLPRYRLLFALFCVFLLCSTAQGTDLTINVKDSIDNTSIPQATVFVNGANYARTNNYGQAFLSHNGLNDQLIRVSMSGYDEWEQTVSRNVSALYVNLTRKTLTLTVTLYDSDTLSPVSGAKVNITSANVTEGKQTDAAGAAVFAVKANYLYSVGIVAPNYQPRYETVDVGTENKPVQYWLLSGNRFSITVKDKDTKTAIEDAEVRIDGSLVGKTDSRGILITPVTRGKVHLFEIKAPGYQTVSESRTITEADAMYTAEVSKAAVGTYIFVFDEKKVPLGGADIYFNGTLTGTTNDYGRSTFPALVTGAYLVEVRKPGYVPVSRTILITDQPEDHTFDLAFESSALSVFVKDKEKNNLPGAAVSVNGQDAGITNDQGLLVTQVSFNIPLNISVSKEGYGSVSFTEKIIQGNATASANITLEKNLDFGLVTLIGAVVIIVIVLFGALRFAGSRRHRHILRRDEI